MIDPLFEAITINGLEIKNRVCMPAMHLNMCRQFQVTDPLTAFYAERAAGGAGLIIVGYATVDENAGNTANIGAHHDDFLPGLTRLAEAIKRGGTRAGVQINHAGRYNFSMLNEGRQAVAPSAIQSRLTGETPRPLSLDDIRQTIDCFASAALRVKTAGFDLVEILCGTGYLISEFLSPLTNQRTDEYGGSWDNRTRFGLEVVRAVRSAVGKDYPVTIRVNGNDLMPGGNSRRDLQRFTQALVAEGVDAVSVNAGWHEAGVPQISAGVPRGAYGYLARGIKELIGVPVIAGHRINTPGIAREMIADGWCDMVAMGRALIADSHLPEKARTHNETAIVHCTACGQGCFDHLFEKKPVACLCNPRAGREIQTKIQTAAVIKKVLVVGGGPAGIQAAITAAQAGHQVTLMEKQEYLGGQLLLAAAPPGRQTFYEMVRDLEHQLALTSAKILLRQQADEDRIIAEKPDAVIIATGAEPVTPILPGTDLPHVYQAWDVLAGRVFTGHRVAIVGGGAVGVETALFLLEKGTLSAETVKFLLINRVEDPAVIYDFSIHGTKSVVLVEMMDKIGQDIGRTTRWTLLQALKQMGGIVEANAEVQRITPTGLLIVKDGSEKEIPADTVVLAAGARPYNPLEKFLIKEGIPCTVIGDARNIGRAFEAVHQGFEAGRSI